MNRIFSILMSVLLLALATAVPAAWAEPSLILTGQGTSYEVRAAGLEKNGAIDITIGYNPATLASPRVVQGALLDGAMMVPNTTVPGMIRIGIIHAGGISGKGTLLSLGFSPVGDKTGQFTSLAGTTYDATGNRIQFQTAIQTSDATAGAGTGSTPFTSDVTSSGTSSPAAPQQSASSGSAGAATIAGGTYPATAVPEKSSVPEHPRQEPVSQSETVAEAPPVAPETPARTAPEAVSSKSAAAQRKDVAYASVLERFKEYQGTKTVAAMTKLFSDKPYPGVRQEPVVVIADGSATATIAIDVAESGVSAPNFVLKKATLLSLKTEPGRYLLDVRPDAGSVDAAVKVVDSGGNILIPIISAPRIDASRMPGGKLDEVSVNAYLKQVGNGKDLNGDGKRDYVDEYCAVANFIALPARQ